MAIETIDVAFALADAIDGTYAEGQNVYLSAGAFAAQAYAGLTVVVTIPADTPDDEDRYRRFRFWGEEVRG